MTMKTRILICLGALLAVAAVDSVKNHLEIPKAKVNVKVMDEQGNPVPGAGVSLVFKNPLSATPMQVKGISNAEGCFSAEGGADAAGIGCDIQKEGYYRGTAPIPVFHDIDATLNRWTPWNETYTSVLRLVGNPVALYVKSEKTSIPVLDRPCGYDMEKGDWVAPQGKGIKADLVFTVHRDFKDWLDFTVEAQVSFPQPLDGLVQFTPPAVGQHSIFRWERFAPEIGFSAPHLVRFANHDPRSGKASEITFDTAKRDRGYFFRVRTVAQNGQIVSANYGKIYGDIAIDPRESKTCWISFTYYLNPASLDRNLEWDTKHNLIQGLSWEQTPREP